VLRKAVASVRALIQARMSSRRFPGKVLAPFRGRPLIDHVVGAVRTALPETPLAVVTSTEPSDEPLVAYLERSSVPTFRGPLDDVYDRFCRCIRQHPAEWVLRVCADSPLLSTRTIRRVAATIQNDRFAAQADLITTAGRRTFPKGQNVELIRTATLLSLPPGELEAADREHVTAFFYRHPDRFAIVDVESGDASLGAESVAVDTLEGLQRLEGLDPRELERLCAGGTA